ncbi:MAG TPA: hypothetical protein PL131_01010 [Methylotenera sp.]|nr:hypothetical protein [Methylotenera sp.]HPH04426.1 hypothetical protein [Methylotenera sp.]HPN01560.1 hypothetical protein [Methylotenera sp.]
MNDKTKNSKLDTQIVGNIGMFYACYHLSLRGWNVMPTSRNARGVDIIAYNSSATEYIGVQVKTLSNRNAVPLGNSLEKIMGDFWIIIDKVSSEPRVFILLPNDIKGLAKYNEKDGKRSYWLNPQEYDQPCFADAWKSIGLGF